MVNIYSGPKNNQNTEKKDIKISNQKPSVENCRAFLKTNLTALIISAITFKQLYIQSV